MTRTTVASSSWGRCLVEVKRHQLCAAFSGHLPGARGKGEWQDSEGKGVTLHLVDGRWSARQQSHDDGCQVELNASI